MRAHKLDQLERKLQTHDQAITGLMQAIRQLLMQPETKRQLIGVVTLNEDRE